ncbi:hypothetical protein NBRC111894_2078 [Sporolactobacillus inulinus]|uniref:PAS fold-4 domain-containing protein n=1 Tax=Sporolactobacillus inulinus TaxID=2078 RepID=A0A4Y1ZBY2_9BACL|nr:PAS domain-containing protein [Sporolactobacillus inulinus]GAY76524.1 hypothetical protein NBRC111894_2078 [Sporolactobacillus inulinus]
MNDAHLPGILNCINEGIVLTKRNLEITFWNPFMEGLHGEKSSKILGQKLDDVLPSLKQPFFSRAMEQLVVSGNPLFFRQQCIVI